MTDAKKSSSTDQAWQEVGEQFRSLGQSLAAAFKSTWASEETRQHLDKMQAGFETMADELSQVAKTAAGSVEAQKVKSEVEKAAQSAKSAGEQTVEEVRPQLISAFRTIRAELDQIISRLEHEPPSTPAAGPDETTPPAD